MVTIWPYQFISTLQSDHHLTLYLLFHILLRLLGPPTRLCRWTSVGDFRPPCSLTRPLLRKWLSSFASAKNSETQFAVHTSSPCHISTTFPRPDRSPKVVYFDHKCGALYHETTEHVWYTKIIKRNEAYPCWIQCRLSHHLYISIIDCWQCEAIKRRLWWMKLGTMSIAYLRTRLRVYCSLSACSLRGFCMMDGLHLSGGLSGAVVAAEKANGSRRRRVNRPRPKPQNDNKTFGDAWLNSLFVREGRSGRKFWLDVNSGGGTMTQCVTLCPFSPLENWDRMCHVGGVFR